MGGIKNNAIYYWLLSGCAIIALMVVVGGITRLTQSGLSMVEWKPIVGAIPPLNEKEWLVEFEKYKTSPEYKVYHSHFSLNDFKSIFFWEYLHRLIGRILGLVFIIPCIIFWLKGHFSPEMKKKVVIILIGGLLQGVLGWFMVKSGLVNNPHVSHYRLAAHLMMALSLIVYIYWTALYYKHGIRKNVNSFISNKLINGLLLLVSIQIVYGAFVAGLKAGKMYNTFPKMGTNWFPKEIGQGFNEFGLYALTESHAIVQLIHRIIGISCFLIALFLLVKSKKYPRPISPSVRYLAMLVIFQVVLGVFTLVMAVPINLGVLHQSIAIVILLAIFKLKFKNRFSGKVN